MPRNTHTMLYFRKEIWKILKRSVLLATIEPVAFVTAGAATFIAAVTIILTGQILTPENAFMLLAFMYLLRRTLAYKITNRATLVVESFVSLSRTQKCLLLENLPLNYQGRHNLSTHIYPECTKDDGCHPLLSMPNSFLSVEEFEQKRRDNKRKTGISVSRLTCKATGSSAKCLLSEVSFEAPARSLTIITGPVGSGKSTLLSSIAGEVALSNGAITYTGNIAYVPQKSWVFSGSIRDNILFGKSYEVNKFARVLEVCDLQEDIRRLPRGDLSFVGERGVVLSGGQRAHVSLARAVYADADLYLLDDPLSAVDAKVGEHIFNKCICHQLCDKIRILVSHDKKHLEAAGQVLEFDKGSLVQKGALSRMEHEHVLDTEKKSTDKRMTQGNEEQVPKPRDAFHKSCDFSPPEHLEISQEDRAVGTISVKLYWNYFRAGMHPAAIFAVTVLLLATQGLYSVTLLSFLIVEMTI